MKVAVDAQLTIGTATGIGEYQRGLIDSLRNQSIDVVELSEPKLDPWRFDRRVFWDQVLLPQRARQSGAELLHCTAGTVPLANNVAIVVTVHDVAWLRVQAHTRPYARYYFGNFAVERYRRAQAIIVDSEFSRNELLELVSGLDPDRVRVVYPGVAADFCALVRRAGDRHTILVVGTVERRKNLDHVIRALPFLENARIVSVGPFTPYQTECAEIAETLDVADRVDFRGYVTRDELIELYATCGVVAMPSKYEGFGYGAAQALCIGVPCISSDVSSLPEIVGNDARMVPLDHIAPWVEALEATLRGDDDARAANARSSAIERFSWEHSAKETISAYELALRN